MSKFQGFCPQCGEHIPLERYVGGRAICLCGWRDETAFLDASDHRERVTAVGYVAITFVSAFVLAYMFSWGSHALDIPGLKIAAWTGTLSPSGYKELGQDCVDLGKLNSAEHAYFQMYRDAHDAEGLALLASLQARQGKAIPATMTYAAYFQAGGTDVDATVGYAKLLEANKQVEPALKQYDLAAQRARADVLPVAAISGSVRLLISQRRLEEAYARILTFHASAENAKGYLNTERANLESWLGPKLAAAVQARISARTQAQASPGLDPRHG